MAPSTGDNLEPKGSPANPEHDASDRKMAGDGEESRDEAPFDLDPRDSAAREPLPGRLPPLAIVALTLVIAAAAVAVSLRPHQAGGWSLWLGLGIPYLALGAYAAYLMFDEGTLVDRVTPRGGDITLGVLVAAALLFASWTLRANVAPAGSEWQGWVARIYLVLGDPSAIQRSAALTIALLVVAGLQELTWRGMVQDAMERQLGVRAGWIVTAVLFTVATAPTLFTLRDPVAGLNPLAVVAALGCGLAWGFLTRVAGRLWPAMFSHMAFLYFSAVQFHIPGLTPPPV